MSQVNLIFKLFSEFCGSPGLKSKKAYFADTIHLGFGLMYELPEFYLQDLGEINFFIIFFCTDHTGQYPSLYLVQNPFSGALFMWTHDFWKYTDTHERLEIQYLKRSSVVWAWTYNWKVVYRQKSIELYGYKMRLQYLCQFEYAWIIQ